jgi:hypothetical protein
MHGTEVEYLGAEMEVMMSQGTAAEVEAIDGAVLAREVGAINEAVEETERLAIAKARYLAKYAAIRREQKKR